MVANFWRMMLAWQFVLAIVIAVGASWTVGEAALWRAALFALVAFVGIQCAVIWLTFAVSRVLAGPEPAVRDFRQTVRAMLTEPVAFALAQLALARPFQFQLPAQGGGSDDVARSPLLLVHGLATNRGVWRWLFPRLRAAGFECIHAVDLEPMRADIDVLTRSLVREIQQIRDLHMGARITIVAYSMGGLITRAALGALPAEAIRHVITVGTPHHGAAIARMLSWPCAQQMCPGSAWLAELNELQEGRLPVPLTAIRSREDNLVRPTASAKLHGAKCLEVRGLGHFGLLISSRSLDCVLRALREVA
ncbi:MAG TPA: alpha/beta fold hydrolase [Steroidobacteraceae bacterium]|nr:alpha/beta fold hydrolase [Steroidobacteraceae bacterium]